MSREDASHLLYVDPDEVYRREVASVFEPDWTVTTAECAADGRAAIDGSVDCVVAADRLPETSGLNFFDTVDEEADGVPFVLFAAAEDVDLLRRAFRAGVTDVIYKQRSPGVSGERTDADRTDAEHTDAEHTDATGGSAGTVADTQPTRTPTASAATEISDGIVGLRNRVGSLEVAATDLNGMALDVSRSLMGAAPDEMAMKTEWALQSLAEEIDANHCLIYETDDDIETLELTHGWSADDVSETEPHHAAFGIGSAAVETERFPGFETRLQQFEAACVDVTQFADATTAADAAESGSLVADADEGTLLALPIVIEWQLSGLIVVTVDRPMEWTESARQRLQAVGELVGHMERRRRQREELERQNEQLEQFASVISHDLQNPLNVISGYLDLAIETENVEHLDPAVDAADRMEALLNDLLMLAREGRAVGETEPVELEALVSEAWNSVETYEASLEVVDLDKIGMVEADQSRLQEVFENFFKNAIVHAGEDVEMRVIGDPDEEVVMVADDGPGIPEEKRDVVFEYGHTGGDGTGLGLAIVRSIIEGHGWEISVAESEAGGARFDIEL